MKIVRIIAQWLFILCLPVLLLAASVSLAVNCPWLYQYGFAKYDVGPATGLAESEQEKVISGIITYFNSAEESLNITVERDGRPFILFNDREVSHMRDVKGLFRLVYVILLGTGVYAVVYAGASLFWWRDRRLYRGLLGGGGLTLALMLVMGLAVAIDFDWLFLQFHFISFDNYLWQLDPFTDYLIRFFPRGFYFDAALYCALATAFLALVLGGLGWWRLRKCKNQVV